VGLAFQWAMGDRPLLVSSVGEPEETPIYPPQFFTDEKGRRQPVTWRDDCQKFVSQMWFFGAAVVRKVSPILRQWRDRRIATGLRMTGTRS